MMTAPSPAGDGGADGRSAALVYLSYGFSVIPIAPGQKKPLGVVLPEGKWEPFQTRLATAQEVNGWFDIRPSAGVGIVCGKVSGGLYCLDVDDAPYAAWLESDARDVLERTWVVRTGSGKLHVWVRSETPVQTTNIVGAGRKLADVRGDGKTARTGGSYMVAPPSLHPSGQPYETLFGDPKTVPSVPDAMVLFNHVKDKYTRGDIAAVIRDAGVDEAEIDVGDKTILEPPGEEVRSSLLHRVEASALSIRVKKAIVKGAQHGVGAWSGAPSNSEIDHQVFRELAASGFSFADIEQVFAAFPIGDNCYRKKDRPNRGRGYLAYSWAKAHDANAEEQKARQAARGDNFEALKVVRVAFAPPKFEVLIRHDTGEHVVTLVAEDLLSERRFSVACMNDANFVPRLPKHFQGQKFADLADLILRMSVEESVPGAATTGGHLRAVISHFVRKDCLPFEPEDETPVLGWRSDGHAYVRGVPLLARITANIRPSPAPEKVWEVLRRMGGEEIAHTWGNGAREGVWAVPLPSVGL